jgi:hypothetical protein
VSWLDEAKRLTMQQTTSEAGVKVHRSSMSCPACSATKRGNRDRRLPASFGSLGWRCWVCGASGDALDVLAFVVTGSRLGSDRAQLETLRADLAARGLISDDDHRPARRAPRRPAPPPPPPEPPPSESWPPLNEVMAFYTAGRPISEDDEVVAYLEDRYQDHAERLVALLDHLDLARVIPDTPAPWARIFGKTWQQQGFRLMFPLVDATGQMRSMRVRRTTLGPSELPKALPPVGYGCRGLVLACDRAVALLRRDIPAAWPEGLLHRLTIVEGETDWMTHLILRKTPTDPALIALYSGAWLPDHSAALPQGSILTIRTDNDEAGHRYAEGVVRASRNRKDLTLLRGGVQ